MYPLNDHEICRRLGTIQNTTLRKVAARLVWWDFVDLKGGLPGTYRLADVRYIIRPLPDPHEIENALLKIGYPPGQAHARAERKAGLHYQGRLPHLGKRLREDRYEAAVSVRTGF